MARMWTSDIDRTFPTPWSGARAVTAEAMVSSRSRNIRIHAPLPPMRDGWWVAWVSKPMAGGLAGPSPNGTTAGGRRWLRVDR